MTLHDEIERSLDKCLNEDVKAQYTERLAKGKLVRDEDELSHFCAYFAPYNASNQTVFIGDHIKSGLWLMPGGHIEANEGILTTLNREIKEELGVNDFFDQLPEPFLLTITDIETDVRPCQKHFDIWHLVPTDGSDFEVDFTEYKEVCWVTLPEARTLMTDPANIHALDAIESLAQ